MDSIEYFRTQACECREAAKRCGDREDRHGFEQLARHYDREVARLSRSPESVQPMPRIMARA